MKKKILNLIYTLLFIAFSLNIQAQWNNPAVYYQFNETTGSLVVDSSGNNFDCYANCDSCWETKGKFNGAFHFNGIHKMDLPAKDIAITTKEGTVAFWVLLPKTSANTINCIWWAGETSGDMFGPHKEMHVCTEAGLTDQYWAHSEVAFVVVDSIAKKQYFIYSDPWKGPVAATAPSEHAISIADSSWHHVACTWDSGGTVGLYIDGQAIWDSTSYNPNLWDCKIMTIGAANKRANRRLYGYLDEFRIYNKALNAAEIMEICNYNPKENTNIIETIKKTSIATLNLYPNPAGKMISFFNAFNIETIEIYNLTGKKLLAQQISSTNGIVEININQLSSGLYFIRAYDNSKLITIGKFSKK
ncbi:MAG: T9SS type A sorting domain-containing protein [Bacteroidales bacterium]|nr:T9SS type A sorting domain-containing protein [Bacteroidales bacterium]